MLSSVASLSSSKRESSQIARTYRQAAQLFLTRRLPEALSTIEPVITPQRVEHEGDDSRDDPSGSNPAPIATASRGTRVKVWSFYLTFLNSVVELGPEEGKHSFGSTKWKALVAKARDGSIWEEVVRNGYGGAEGDVDGEVVVNLATLVLTHSPSQKLNQQRLENYFSSSAHPSYDVAAHMESSRPDIRRQTSANGHNGASTPRDLGIRLKLLELFTLHVLPRNDEWDYAKEFISMSEVLDEERREAFLLALASLREEKEHAASREIDLQRRQQEESERKRKEAEARQAEARSADGEKRKGDNGNTPPVETSGHATKPSNERLRPKTPAQRAEATSGTPSRASQPSRKAAGTPQGLYKRASLLLDVMHRAMTDSARSMAGNPLAWLRTLVFLLAFLITFTRKEVRDRIRRATSDGWNKVLRTIGMGVKVSYI